MLVGGIVYANDTHHDVDVRWNQGQRGIKLQGGASPKETSGKFAGVVARGCTHSYCRTALGDIRSRSKIRIERKGNGVGLWGERARAVTRRRKPTIVLYAIR